MHRRTAAKIGAALLLAILTVSGCATVSPQPDYERVRRHVEQATGVPRPTSPADDAFIAARVAELLSGGLTSDKAVQLALLNNPRLRAELLTVGMGRAQVVQSTLFTNPVLTLSTRWPDGGGMSNLEFGISQNIAELWQIPLRTKAAEHDLERTILEVARNASVTALEAKAAYFKAVRADRDAEIARQNVDVTRQLVDLARARREAGAGSEVDVNLARARQMDSQLQARRAEVTAVEARSDVARLCGLATPPEELALAEPLPEPAAWTLAAEDVIAVAREQRLDVRAVRQLVDAAQARVALEKTRFLRSLEVGLSVERSERASRGDRNWLADAAWATAEAGELTTPSLRAREPVSTDWVVGPTLGIEVPLFDQNQAQIAKAEYERQQAQEALVALDRELAQQAHVALKRAQVAAENARVYHDDYLPLQEASLQLAEEAYRVGRTPLLTVLDVQRGLLEARAGYVAALADAGLALVELERVAGLPIAALLDAPASAAAAESNDVNKDSSR
jgi:outer membrane protein, heavy metal efflux system